MITLTLILALTAHADIGPKPMVYFSWKNHAGVELDSVKLLQCKDPACNSAEELQQLGPQHFSCCVSGCFGMAYGFSDVSQIEAKIDGKEVRSAPFSIAKPDGYFELSAIKGGLDVHAVNSMPEERKNSIQYCK